MAARGKVHGEAKLPTPQEGGPARVTDQIAEAMREAAAAAGVETAELAGTGVGSPGAVDGEEGTVAEARNLPDWEEAYPLAAELSERSAARWRSATTCRWRWTASSRSAPHGEQSLLGVWWGTGRRRRDHPRRQALDRARRRRRRSATWWSRWTGRAAPAAATAAWRRTRAAARWRSRRAGSPRRGTRPDLFEIMEKRGRTRLQSGVWERALEREDALAIKLIDRAVEALGAGVASVVNVLDVETVVIGGGLGTRLGEPYVERIREAMQPHLFVSDRPPGGAPRGARRPGRRDRREPARQGSTRGRASTLARSRREAVEALGVVLALVVAIGVRPVHAHALGGRLGLVRALALVAHERHPYPHESDTRVTSTTHDCAARLGHLGLVERAAADSSSKRGSPGARARRGRAGAGSAAGPRRRRASPRSARSRAGARSSRRRSDHVEVGDRVIVEHPQRPDRAFGETFTCPSPASGAVPTKNRACFAIQSRWRASMPS